MDARIRGRASEMRDQGDRGWIRGRANEMGDAGVRRSEAGQARWETQGCEDKRQDKRDGGRRGFEDQGQGKRDGGRRGCEDQGQGKRGGGRRGCEDIWWNNSRNHPPWTVSLVLAEELVAAAFYGHIYRVHICKPDRIRKVRGRAAVLKKSSPPPCTT